MTTLNRAPSHKKRGGGAPFSGTHTAEKANRGLCRTPDESSHTGKAGQ